MLHNVIMRIIKSYDYSSTFKSAISNCDQERLGFINAKLKCSYNNLDGEEYFNFYCINPSIDQKCNKNILPVSIKNESNGLSSSNIVALFPENFYLNEVKEDDPVFYFVNRFLERHKNITQKCLKRFFNNFFIQNHIEILEINDPCIFSNWVILHEKYHRVGILPLPANLKLKSCKILSAIEELRVDVLSLLECIEKYNDIEYKKTFYIILCERMIGYPFHRTINSFDSIASIILYSFLRDTNGILDIKFQLFKLLKRINSVESESLKLENRRMYLIDHFEKLHSECFESKLFFKKCLREL